MSLAISGGETADQGWLLQVLGVWWKDSQRRREGWRCFPRPLGERGACSRSSVTLAMVVLPSEVVISHHWGPPPISSLCCLTAPAFCHFHPALYFLSPPAPWSSSPGALYLKALNSEGVTGHLPGWSPGGCAGVSLTPGPVSRGQGGKATTRRASVRAAHGVVGPQSSGPMPGRSNAEPLSSGDLGRTGTLSSAPEIPGFPDRGNERQFDVPERKRWAGAWCPGQPWSPCPCPTFPFWNMKSPLLRQGQRWKRRREGTMSINPPVQGRS